MKFVIVLFLLVSIPEIGETQTRIPFRDGTKWGYSDENGNVKIKPEFDEARIFITDVTGVKKNGNFAIINKQGELLTDFEFERVGNWGFGLIYSLKDENRTCYSSLGIKVRCIWGCGTVNYIRSKKFSTFKENGKIGIYNTEIEIDSLVTKVIYKDTFPAIWNEIIENGNGVAAVNKGGRWGVIDDKQNLLVDYKYDCIEIDKSRKMQYCFKTTEKGKVGFVDETGKVITEPKYLNADYFSDGLAKVWINSDFWFYIDKNGIEHYKK